MGHIHELYDFTIGAFIVFEDKVLLMNHKKLGTWIQPGGHIELDEDPEMTLWKEIEEETGLTKDHLTLYQPEGRMPFFDETGEHKRLPIPFDFNVHPYGPGATHKHIDLCYLVYSDTDQVNQNEGESDGLKWFSKQDLKAAKDSLWPDIYKRAMFILNIA
mgnify:CR=1 FL=1